MKILALSSRTPCKKGKADSRTVFYLLAHLAKKGHQVELVCFEPQEDYERHDIKELRGMCSRVHIVPLNKSMAYFQVIKSLPNSVPLQSSYYKDRAFGQRVDRVMETFQPDCIYSHLIRTSEYVKDKAIPKMLGMQIAQTLNYKRYLEYDNNILRKIFFGIEYRKVRDYEPMITQHFDKVLLISPHDKKALEGNKTINNIEFCPHGIDVQYFMDYDTPIKTPNSIVMNGDFGTSTNIHAAEYFINQIFPTIQKAIPDCQVTFTGRSSDKALAKYASAYIKLTGRVEDIRPHICQAQVAINPVMIGAGMQNKTLVSMACGVPVVSTEIANEGISALPDHEIIIANEPMDFAEQVIALLQNPIRRQQIANNAKSFVAKKWNFDVHHDVLEEILLGMVG